MDRSARAVWFTAPRTAELREDPVTEPGAGEVLVRASASLISAGTEMTTYRGEAPSFEMLDMPGTEGEFPFPIKFAYQVVGTVEEAGPEAAFAVGDRLFCYHPHQELFRIATRAGGGDDLVSGAALVFPVPDDVEDEQAAFGNLFCVAYNALLDVPIRIGDVAVVSGLGVIGHFAAALARLTAGRLILVDPLPERRERVAYVGADAVVDPSELAAAVDELSDGRGADVAVEASGAPAALQGMIDVTGQEGTIVVISYYGDRLAQLRLSPEFHLRRQRIVSSMVGAIGSGLEPRWTAERRMAVAMEKLGAMDLEPLITHRFAFEDAPAAYRQIDEHAEQSLGVMLGYGS